MGAAQVDGADFIVQAAGLGQGEAVGDAVIIGLHAQKTSHEGTVGAMAAAGGGKAAVE